MKENEQITELQTNTNTKRITFEIFVQDFKILLNNKLSLNV